MWIENGSPDEEGEGKVKSGGGGQRSGQSDSRISFHPLPRTPSPHPQPSNEGPAPPDVIDPNEHSNEVERVAPIKSVSNPHLGHPGSA